MVINKQAAFTLLENTYLRDMLKDLYQQRDLLTQELAEAQQQLDVLYRDRYTDQRAMEY